MEIFKSEIICPCEKILNFIPLKPDGKEHPGLFNKKGHIGFLGHGSPVKFRNIRIKELK